MAAWVPMSRRNRQRAHLHAVPDIDSTVAAPGRRSASGRNGRAARVTPLDPARDRGPRGGVVASSGSPRATPVPELLDQLVALGVPPDLVEQSRTLGDEHQAELAGLLRAATAMLTGDPVAGLLGVWEPLLDPHLNALDAELAAAEILWSINGAIGDDDLADGLTRLIEEAAATGRSEALVMCRMLTHLGPPEVRSPATRAANLLIRGGLEDRPWVSALGTAAFHRAHTLVAGPARALVAEFGYGRRPHAVVVEVDEIGAGLVGLCVTDEVDELARQVRLDAAACRTDLTELRAAEAAELIRGALVLPLCPEDEDDEAEMESVVPIVRERLRRMPGARAAPSGPPPVG
jgi:hypothetical protein